MELFKIWGLNLAGMYLILLGAPLLASACWSIFSTWFQIGASRIISVRIYSVLIAVAVAWHELCHLVTGLIFAHRPQAVKLYQNPLKNSSGTAGYVTFSFHPNWYTTTGNFFIGLAPVLLSLLTITGGLHLFGVGGTISETGQIMLIGFTQPALIWLGGSVLFALMAVFHLSGKDWHMTWTGVPWLLLFGGIIATGVTLIVQTPLLLTGAALGAMRLAIPLGLILVAGCCWLVLVWLLAAILGHR